MAACRLNGVTGCYKHQYTVMFKLKNDPDIGVAVGNVKFAEDQLIANIERSFNVLGHPPQEGIAER